MSLKKNDRITLQIHDLNNLGFGVGHREGMAIFVADTVMGDSAEVQIIKVNKTYAIGKVLSLVTPSEQRVSPRCTLACRSCA